MVFETINTPMLQNWHQMWFHYLPQRNNISWPWWDSWTLNTYVDVSNSIHCSLLVNFCIVLLLELLASVISPSPLWLFCICIDLYYICITRCNDATLWIIIHHQFWHHWSCHRCKCSNNLHVTQSMHWQKSRKDPKVGREAPKSCAQGVA